MLASDYGGSAARSAPQLGQRTECSSLWRDVIAVALAMLLEVDGQVTVWLSQFYPSGSGGL